jgi:hypothetical protein
MVFDRILALIENARAAQQLELAASCRTLLVKALQGMGRRGGGNTGDAASPTVGKEGRHSSLPGRPGGGPWSGHDGIEPALYRASNLPTWMQHSRRGLQLGGTDYPGSWSDLVFVMLGG